MKPGQRLSVTATEIAESGAGIARVDGVEVHVPGLLPPEAGDVLVQSVSRHHPRAFAEALMRRGGASPDRQAPKCPAFGRCGGCSWQHLRYPAQLEHKRRRVARALSAVPGCEKVPTPWPAPAELGYRNKGIYVPAPRDGRVILGGRAPQSADVVDTRRCRVVAPLIDAVASDLADWLTELELAIDDDSRRPGALRYVIIRLGARDQVALGLITRSPRPDLGALVERLEADARIATAVHATNDRLSGAVLGDERPTPLFGSGTVPVSLGAIDVDAGIDSFAQVNSDQAARLYGAVAEWAKDVGAMSAVDLYCGLGGFAFALAFEDIEVQAFDRSLDVERAARAAQRQGPLPVSFTRTDAAEADLGQPDFLVVNPPRKGLSPTALELALRAAPAHIAYVSCAPESLARDLAQLVTGGYRVIRLQPVDLMPGTAQIETLVLLERADTAAIG